MDKKVCGQVTIPVIDNTEIECDEIISAKCITVKKFYKKIGNVEGENLEEFFERLNTKLAVMDNKILLLTQALEQGGINIQNLK